MRESNAQGQDIDLRETFLPEYHPTGGNCGGINGGNMLFLRLPYSGIEMDIPLFGTFAPDPQPDQGLILDIRVSPTAEDIAHGVDVDGQAILKMPID